MTRVDGRTAIADRMAVHGGVAAAGLEFAASVAINDGRADTPLKTASLRDDGKVALTARITAYRG